MMLKITEFFCGNYSHGIKGIIKYLIKIISTAHKYLTIYHGEGTNSVQRNSFIHSFSIPEIHQSGYTGCPRRSVKYF